MNRNDSIANYVNAINGIIDSAATDGNVQVSNKQMILQYHTNARTLEALEDFEVIELVKRGSQRNPSIYKVTMSKENVTNELAGKIFERALTLKREIKKAVKQPEVKATKQPEAKVKSEFFSLRQLSFITSLAVKAGQKLTIKGVGTINDAVEVQMTVNNDSVDFILKSKADAKFTCRAKLNRLEVINSKEELLLIPRN